MINFVHRWVDELNEELTTFNQIYNNGKPLEEEFLCYVKYEKFMFVSAFMLRKIYEYHDFSGKEKNYISFNLDCTKLKYSDEGNNYISPVYESLKSNELCNLLIHSKIFEVCDSKEKRFEIVRFTSDKNIKVLYVIETEKYIAQIENIIRKIS